MTNPNPESVQEGAATDADRLASLVKRLVADNRQRPGALLPILHALQAERGHIPDAAVALLSEALTLTRAEIHGVISFYHDFRTTPGGEHRLQVCRAEACQAQGGRELEAAAQQHLGLDWGQTTADGRVTLEPVYCLGNCATGPAVRLDDDILGRVTPARLSQLIDDLQRDPVNMSALQDGAGSEVQHG